MKEGNKDIKRTGLFLLICFAITYITEITLVNPMMDRARNGGSQALTTTLMALCMMTPAISVVLTRLITKEGFKDHMVLFNLKGNGRYYILAWFLPPVLTALGALLYFMIFRDRFDPAMKYLVDTYEKATGIRYDAMQLRATILSQTAAGVLLGPVLNFVTCFGEEWGWRGYLLPKLMKKFDAALAALLTGLIWGLWHAPIVYNGYNYGTDYAPGWCGVLAMCVFCMVIGMVEAFLVIRTGSVVPAIIVHGSINAISSVGIYFTDNGGNPYVGPSPLGIVGGIGFIITAVVMALMLIKDKSVKEAQV